MVYVFRGVSVKSRMGFLKYIYVLLFNTLLLDIYKIYKLCVQSTNDGLRNWHLRQAQVHSTSLIDDPLNKGTGGGREVKRRNMRPRKT